MPKPAATYFPYVVQLSSKAWNTCRIAEIAAQFSAHKFPKILFFRRLAMACAESELGLEAVSAAQLNLYATLLEVYRYLVDELAAPVAGDQLIAALSRSGVSHESHGFRQLEDGFIALFPPVDSFAGCRPKERLHVIIRELLLLRVAAENRALDQFRPLLDDTELLQTTNYADILGRLEKAMDLEPVVPELSMPLIKALRAPLKDSPDSLAGQLGYIRDKWGELIPAELITELYFAFDLFEEAERQRSAGGPGPAQVLRFGGEAFAVADGDPGHMAGYDQPEYEAFSPDADWMSNVVLIAKMTYVWMHQLSAEYGYPVSALDQIPDAELDRLAARGFTGLWLIGIWERSPASKRIKQLCGNPEAISSAYSLYDYVIAADIGGEQAFWNLKERAAKRGIRLASDMVPNHTGIYSRWIVEHPDWFIQTDYPPFPTYRYNGEDLSHEDSLTIQVEDGYWSKTEAAVTFRVIDRRDGRTRYIYHGNDGTSIPWNDTAQLNYLIPEVREAVIQTILHVARLTPIIRFDAAMTLAKKHYQRLWFPQRGLGGGIPSRAEYAMSRDEFDAVFPREFWREVVDRVAAEAPGTLLLAEAFWLMEGYFVRTLGMHRVYNSAFMNMLKDEENAKYRQTIRNVIEFNPEILKRFVNFMNNPDEKTAAEQFGSQGKYFGACVLLATMPGLPMFGHGQIEGFREKYGMEYFRPYWDEKVDNGLMKAHEMWIFPLLRMRWIFSGSEQFELFDFYSHNGAVDENVFAYTNRAGGSAALVLFHNRHACTAGWIRWSAAKAGSAETGLQRTNLGGALGLPLGADMFVTFRDLVTEKEYLRSCKDLHENGMYAELGQYQFHIFVDFKVLQDLDDAGWAQLNNELSGAPVDSIEEERLRIKNRPLVVLFEEMLSRLGEAVQAEKFSSSSAYFEKAAKKWHQCSAKDGVKTSFTLLASCFELRIVRSMLRILRASGLRAKDLSASGVRRRQMLILALLHGIRFDLTEKKLFELGLSRSCSNYVAGGGAVERGTSLWICRSLDAALHGWVLWSGSGGTGVRGWLERVFENRLITDYMQVHQDSGVVWFNKECFEELNRWLATAVALEAACKGGDSKYPAAALQELAAASGYRRDRFLSLVGAL